MTRRLGGPGDPYGSERRRGRSNGANKLSEAQVRAIRSRYRPGMGGKLAREYGINPRTVSAIVNFETWGWLA